MLARAFRHCVPFCAGLVAFGLATTNASAQTYGFATLPPGTLNHTTASAVSKVMKEKAGVNMLVQPTAGDNVIIPMVARGEAEIGIANVPEIAGYMEKNPNLRLIGVANPLRSAFWVRKDSPMKTTADLKGKKVALGYSAMRMIDVLSRAILATGGLSEKDVSPVLVPNVMRGADDFVASASDMYFFAFGAPKVREVDATVGGTRVLEIPDGGIELARKISPYVYLTDAVPGPIFVGVEKPMKVFTFDNMLLTHDKVPDEFVYKFIDTLIKNKDDLVAIQPILRDLSGANLYAKYDVPYHPGALKYYKDNNIEAKSR